MRAVFHINTIHWNIFSNPTLKISSNPSLEFQKGHFKRHHKDQDLRDNPYTEGQKEIIARAIGRLNTVLKQYNKERLPLHKYKHYPLSQ